MVSTNHEIVTHLGKNPIVGGNPLRERRFNEIMNFKVFDIDEKFSWLIFEILKFQK